MGNDNNKTTRTTLLTNARYTVSAALLISLLLVSCISDPSVQSIEPVASAANGVIVMNEGLWRQDNATLTLYDTESKVATAAWFARQNPGMHLGDIGNQITIWKGRAWALISGSATVEVLNLPDGISAGRVRFPEGTFPTSIVIRDDSTGWVSNLEDDSVTEFNPSTMQAGRRIPVGPAPEGMTLAVDRLFVANSGLGALRIDEPGAGTLSVIDPDNGSELKKIPVGGNLRIVHYMPANGMLYVFVGAPLPDTSGSGLVEVDPVSHEVLRRWSISGAWEAGFDNVTQQAYIIAQGGVFRIDLAQTNAVPVRFLSDPLDTLDEEVPHSIAISPYSGEILIGVVRGYFSAPGRVDRYDRTGRLLGSFDAGLNPTAFGFFE